MDNEEFLAHMGVLGMHWGIRRYQNKDGSLTALGKKRYNAVSQAAEQAKKISNYETKQAKKHEASITRKYSSAEKEKIVRKDFGKNGKSALKDLGYKNVDEYIDVHHRSDRKTVDILNRSAQQYANIAKNFGKIKMSAISRKDYKRAKKFMKEAYGGSTTGIHYDKMRKYEY